MDMTRYILVDNNSGYIWGDSADFAPHGDIGGAADAARLLDEGLGTTGRAYELLGRNPCTTCTGYDVYLSELGTDVLPVVHDGQDEEAIAAVQTGCQYLGFVLVHGR
jgi:hypothetical protein